MYSKCVEYVKFAWSKTNRFHRAILVFLAIELRLLPSGQYGFQCGDPALSHTYTGDTISWKLLLSVCVLLPLPILLFVERKYHDEKLRGKKQALGWYKEYIYSLLVDLLLVQILKLVVASPRPHFFDTCQPKEAATCAGSEFISSYTCSKAHWINQSDRSFPSGHTSLALHTAVFVIYYLHRRATNAPATKGVQIACACAAVFCALSRLTDRRHHWWDVLAGAGIAAGLLVYTIFYLCKNFEYKQVNPEKENGVSKTDLPEVTES